MAPPAPRPTLVAPSGIRRFPAAPIPVPPVRGRPDLWSIPVYWHLLSLDAPTVAVLWAWSFGHVAHVRSSPSAVAILGIGTWLIYIADRLLDGRPGAPPRPLRERHRFHARHARALLVAAAAAGIPLLWLIVDRMSPGARREDTILFIASLVYFVVVHRPAAVPRRWFRREFAVGVVFASATAVPAWSQPGAHRGTLALVTLLFAALCCLNCFAIEEWEQAAFSPGFSVHPRRVPVSAVALAVAAAAAALAIDTRGPVTVAALLSALLLFALDRLHVRTPRHAARATALALRIAADAVLLTPLLLVPRWHV